MICPYCGGSGYVEGQTVEVHGRPYTEHVECPAGCFPEAGVWYLPKPTPHTDYPSENQMERAAADWELRDDPY